MKREIIGIVSAIGATVALCLGMAYQFDNSDLTSTQVVLDIWWLILLGIVLVFAAAWGFRDDEPGLSGISGSLPLTEGKRKECTKPYNPGAKKGSPPPCIKNKPIDVKEVEKQYDMCTPDLCCGIYPWPGDKKESVSDKICVRCGSKGANHSSKLCYGCWMLSSPE